MELKAIRAHYIGDKRVDVGATYEADAMLGRQLIAAGKCELNTGEAEAKPAAAKPGPMTTKTSGGLIPGATSKKE